MTGEFGDEFESYLHKARKDPVFNAAYEALSGCERLETDWTVPPGAHLDDWREGQCLTRGKLARKLNVRADQLDDIISGRTSLTDQMMTHLERLTGMSVAFWRKAQANYVADLKRGAKPIVG